jgi:hypothetical protein
LRVTPAGGGAALPIRQVNTLTRGAKITCSALRLPPDMKKNGRIALVAVPASTAGGDGVTVLDLSTLDGPVEWTLPFQAGVVLLVFGPQGLDEKRVNRLVSKDDDLVSELAIYANQTEDLEDTIEALAAVDDSSDEDADPVPLKGSPSDQVLFALTRALNPVLAAYNPLGAGKKAGPATTTGKAADAFFENAGGFVPGGGALPAVKSWLMPDTEFRTVYTEPVASDGLTLCGQRKTANSRNRFVYLWAHRTVNSGPPAITLPQATWLPVAARATVAVKVKADEWPLVDRVREWTMAGGAAPVAVKVRSDQRRLMEIDLRKTALAPGTYRLEGKWDWGTVQVAGEFHLTPPADAAKIRVTAESQGTLVAGRGVIPVRFEGTDFQFVERVTLRRSGRLGGTPADLDYVLPTGPRAGPQQNMEVELDTNHFRAGEYLLAMAQTGGNTQTVPVKVLPAMPKLDNLPLRVNSGAKDLKLVLRGADLDKIDGLTAEHATFRLSPGTASEREVLVTVDGSVKKGDRIEAQIGVGGVADAARLKDALLVLGPRPRIAGVKVAPPDDLWTALREGELPAGSYVGMSIQVENGEGPAALRLDCAEAPKTLEAMRVRAGERRRGAKLDAVSDATLFASLDPGVIGASGCTLQAAVETDGAGISEPVTVGKVIRLPRIESVTLSNEKVDQGFAAVLKGWDLETIEKTGWDAANGLSVPAPPHNTAGEGDRQTLRVVVPWPSPTPLSPLFIWLRGDKEGRSALRK